MSAEQEALIMIVEQHTALTIEHRLLNVKMEKYLRLMRAVVQAGNVQELSKAINDMAEGIRE